MIRLIFSFSLILFSFALIIFSISISSSGAILGAKSATLQEIDQQITPYQTQNSDVKGATSESSEDLAYYKELLNIYKTPPSQAALAKQEESITKLQAISEMIQKLFGLTDKNPT